MAKRERGYCDGSCVANGTECETFKAVTKEMQVTEAKEEWEIAFEAERPFAYMAQMVGDPIGGLLRDAFKTGYNTALSTMRDDKEARAMLAADLVALADGKPVKTALAEAVRVKHEAEKAAASFAVVEFLQ